MPSWLRSLRLRITLVATAVLLVALVNASFALVTSLERTLIGRVREQAVRQVAHVAGAVEQGRPFSARLVSGVVESGVSVGILDESGVVVATVPSGLPTRVVVPGPGVEQEVLPFEGPPTLGDLVVVRRLISGEMVIASRSVDSPAGRRTVVAISPLAEVTQSIDSVVGALRVGTPLLALVAGVITWMVVGRSLRPIESMRGRVEEITHTTLDERLPVPDTGDEVERLATTLNDMLDRLEQAARRQREFVSDASYEMRSPLAAMRTALEVTIAHPDGSDVTELARRLLEENLRLEALVDDLLQLARLEEKGPARSERVDLAAMLREEAGHHVAPGRTPTVRLQFDSAIVSGDPDQLRRVVPTSSTMRCDTPEPAWTSQPWPLTAASSSTSTTTVRAFRPRTANGSSSASHASTRTAPEPTAASASAWPSCNGSCRVTTARSGWSAHRWAEHASRSSCRTTRGDCSSPSGQRALEARRARRDWIPPRHREPRSAHSASSQPARRLAVPAAHSCG